MAGSNARKALPRWLMAFFSSADSSAQLRSLARRLQDGVVAEAAGAPRARAAARPPVGRIPPPRGPAPPACRGRPAPRRRRTQHRGARPARRRAGPAGARGWPASSPCRPAQRAEKIPGAPPITSTARPESSAMATRPVAAATARAFSSEFSAKVTPVSTTSGAPAAAASTTWVSTSSPGTWPRSSSRSSRSLPLLWVASTNRGAAACRVTACPPGFRAGWRRAGWCPAAPGPAAGPARRGRTARPRRCPAPPRTCRTR